MTAPSTRRAVRWRRSRRRGRAPNAERRLIGGGAALRAPALPAASATASRLLLSGALDQLGNPIELLIGKPRTLSAEDRGDDLLGGAVEEGVDQMFQSGPAGGAPRRGPAGKIAGALPFLPPAPPGPGHAQRPRGR